MADIPIYRGGEEAALEGRINPQTAAAEKLGQAARISGQLGREGAEALRTGFDTMGKGIGEGAIDYGKVLEKHMGLQDKQTLAQGYNEADMALYDALQKAQTPADVAAARAAHAKAIDALGQNVQTDIGREYASEHGNEALGRAARESVVYTGMLNSDAAAKTILHGQETADKIFAADPSIGGLGNALAANDRSVAAVDIDSLPPEKREAARAGLLAHRQAIIVGAVDQIGQNSPSQGMQALQQYKSDLTTEQVSTLQNRANEWGIRRQQLSMETERFHSWQADQASHQRAASILQSWPTTPDGDAVPPPDWRENAKGLNEEDWNIVSMRAAQGRLALKKYQGEQDFDQKAGSLLRGDADAPSPEQILADRTLDHDDVIQLDALQRSITKPVQQMVQTTEQGISGIMGGVFKATMNADGTQTTTGVLSDGKTAVSPEQAARVTANAKLELERRIQMAISTQTPVQDVIAQWQREFPTSKALFDKFNSPLQSTPKAHLAQTETQRRAADFVNTLTGAVKTLESDHSETATASVLRDVNKLQGTNFTSVDEMFKSIDVFLPKPSDRLFPVAPQDAKTGDYFQKNGSDKWGIILERKGQMYRVATTDGAAWVSTSDGVTNRPQAPLSDIFNGIPAPRGQGAAGAREAQQGWYTGPPPPVPPVPNQAAGGFSKDQVKQSDAEIRARIASPAFNPDLGRIGNNEDQTPAERAAAIAAFKRDQ
jgi:hypothetical protein